MCLAIGAVLYERTPHAHWRAIRCNSPRPFVCERRAAPQVLVLPDGPSANTNTNGNTDVNVNVNADRSDAGEEDTVHAPADAKSPAQPSADEFDALPTAVPPAEAEGGVGDGPLLESRALPPRTVRRTLAAHTAELVGIAARTVAADKAVTRPRGLVALDVRVDGEEEEEVGAMGAMMSEQSEQQQQQEERQQQQQKQEEGDGMSTTTRAADVTEEGEDEGWYDTLSAPVAQYAVVGPGSIVAQHFRAPLPADLQHVRLNIAMVAPNMIDAQEGAVVNVAVFSHSPQQLPGEWLADLADPLAVTAPALTAVHAFVPLPTVLVPGQDYWLVLTPVYDSTIALGLAAGGGVGGGSSSSSSRVAEPYAVYDMETQAEWRSSAHKYIRMQLS